MKKIFRDFKINFELDWDEIEIKKLRKDLDAIEKLGATHIEIEDVDSYGTHLVKD